MLFKVSWRNVWRNKLRSSVLITSISLGVWAGVFIVALSLGMTNNRRVNELNTTISHIQIHHPNYKQNTKITDTLTQVTALRKGLANDPRVKSFCSRLLLNGMASNSRGGAGVKIMGVNPEEEKSVTNLFQKIKQGAWFEGVKRNPVVLGEKLAKKLKINLRSKIVLTFQDEEHEIMAGAFRVAGIFKTASTQYDESHVYVQTQDLERLLNPGGGWGVMEMAMLVEPFDSIEAVAAKLSGRFENLAIEPWNKISPELGYTDAVMEQYLYIIMGIILLAMAFGILNTMLMAVLERQRELGMMLAIGMNKSKVFLMIIYETIMICLAGGATGIFMGYLSIEYWGRKGIDLSMFKEGLENWGIQLVMYPELTFEYYKNIMIMIVLTALLAAIYPAWRALRLKPAETIRKL